MISQIFNIKNNIIYYLGKIQDHFVYNKNTISINQGNNAEKR